MALTDEELRSGWYVYRVFNRPDGFEYAFHMYANPTRTLAMFFHAIDAQRFADGCRARGEVVHVHPSAVGILQ